MHDDHKFDYIDNIAVRKHLIADSIRYIGKESNNLDEPEVIGLNKEDYLEYTNNELFWKEVNEWILTLKPLDIKNQASDRALQKIQKKIRN
jgi:hypothetical protein